MRSSLELVALFHDKTISELQTQESSCVWFLPDTATMLILKDRLLRSSTSLEKRVFWGHECSLEKVENLFLASDLFASSSEYFILESEKLSASVRQWLEIQELKSTQKIHFLFSGVAPWMAKIAKAKTWQVIEFKSPKFWEWGDVVAAMAQDQKITLGPGVKNYLAQALNPDFSTIKNAIDILKLHSEDGSILKMEVVEKLIPKSYWDHFLLAELLSEKKFKKFFETILEKKWDWEEFRKLHYFLLGHLLKLANPQALNGKEKLNKYDKDILRLSKVWTPDEIMKVLAEIESWDEYLRSKDDTLVNIFRVKSLRYELGP